MASVCLGLFSTESSKVFSEEVFGIKEQSEFLVLKITFGEPFLDSAINQMVVYNEQ